MGGDGEKLNISGGDSPEANLGYFFARGQNFGQFFHRVGVSSGSVIQGCIDLRSDCELIKPLGQIVHESSGL